MIRFFTSVYDYFERHKTVLYVSLILLTGVSIYAAAGIDFKEDISEFMPRTEDSETISMVFKNIKVKDKITFIFSYKDSLRDDPEFLAALCDKFSETLRTTPEGKKYIGSITTKVGADQADRMQDYVFDNIPIFLDSADYARLDTLILPDALVGRMAQNYRQLLSPLSVFSKTAVVRDPLGLAGNALSYLADLQSNADFRIIDGRIFSEDGRYLFAVVSPACGASNIAAAKPFVAATRTVVDEYSSRYPEVEVAYFGAPFVAVANADRIKSDSTLSGVIVLLIVGLVVAAVFKRKSAVFLIMAPVVFGGIAALAVMRIMQGGISTIAIGAGSAIAGVAMSYSIHLFCHSLHVKSAREAISDLAYPMTIGGFTTIGGFFGLTFCSSAILRDFGYFSCFTLVGTTLFSLVYLPHFLKYGNDKPGKLLNSIEKINSISFDKKIPTVVGTALLIVVSLFFAGNVGFDSDMNKLNYMPRDLARAESILNKTFAGGDLKTVFFISTGKNADEALTSYKAVSAKFESLKNEGLIEEYSTAERLLIPPSVQKRRIAMWEDRMTDERKQAIADGIGSAAERRGFKPGAFDRFIDALNKTYRPVDYGSPEADATNNWFETSPDITMAVTSARLTEKNKEAVYGAFSESSDMVILDKPYFASKLAGVVNDDFNKALYIVSILVFVAIFLSYGRIELTLITFLPMAAAWFIILGLMALFGIEFNIVNIVISTFIFGIGDDFSIFVTDGLLHEYKYGRKMLSAHKTAIFFSSFTVMAGLGAMIFSKHPALYSVSVTSIIGMAAVVLVAYTLQPFFFRLLISGRTAVGKFPHTWYTLLTTFVALTVFVIGSFTLALITYPLLLIPSKKFKKRIFRTLIYRFTRTFFFLTHNSKEIKQNPSSETFRKPAVIIANHQSVIDILQMSALDKNIVMVVKSWVINSPIFGRAVRFAGFVDITGGYENAVEALRNSMSEGCSVVVFPEGTRSEDGKIGRFRKGAFFLAQELRADIVPVLLHGTGQIISKNDIFYVKNGMRCVKILPRIPFDDASYGTTYGERCKNIARMFKAEHEAFVRETDKVNSHYRFKLIKNYVYKGPVLEWYLRVKARLENDYKLFEELVPYDATVTDVGCGYGFSAYMLAFKSDKRKITGIDYDKDKIETANRNFSKTANLDFISADAVACDMKPSDVFILGDVLHYIPLPMRAALLNKCVEALKPGGKIIIRDGDMNKTRKHKITRLTEFFSIRILNFNKAEHDPDYLTGDEIRHFADSRNLKLTISDARIGSNTVYVLTN